MIWTPDASSARGDAALQAYPAVAWSSPTRAIHRPLPLPTCTSRQALRESGCPTPNARRVATRPTQRSACVSRFGSGRQCARASRPLRLLQEQLSPPRRPRW